MDAAAILTALDFIRNEEVYTKRYNFLQEEQKKLEKLQETMGSIEQIQKTGRDADARKNEYIKKLEQFNTEIALIRTERLADIEDREEQANLKEQSLKQRESDLKDQVVLLRMQQNQLKIDQDNLVKQTAAVQQSLQEATDVRTQYTSKLNELKRIVANG